MVTVSLQLLLLLPPLNVVVVEDGLTSNVKGNGSTSGGGELSPPHLLGDSDAAMGERMSAFMRGDV